MLAGIYRRNGRTTVHGAWQNVRMQSSRMDTERRGAAWRPAGGGIGWSAGRRWPTRQRKPAKSVVCLPIDSSTSDPQGHANSTISIVARRSGLIEVIDAFGGPRGSASLLLLLGRCFEICTPTTRSDRSLRSTELIPRRISLFKCLLFRRRAPKCCSPRSEFNLPVCQFL